MTQDRDERAELYPEFDVASEDAWPQMPSASAPEETAPERDPAPDQAPPAGDAASDVHEPDTNTKTDDPTKRRGKKKRGKSAMDRFLLDESGQEAANYTGDEESERDYRPIRQSHEYRSGCLGGVMYFVFVMCLGVVLACLAWMAASDMLALNKTQFEATVTLPMSIFSTETVTTFDEDGEPSGTKRVARADIDYMADALKDAGLIEYKWLFTFFCRLSHADTKVSPGEYQLRSSYDYRALIQHMTPNSSGALTVKVTFPEGLNMRQIFQLLEENDVAGYDELMEAAADYKFNYDFLEGVEEGEASRLEGYLFPDTYEFYVNMQASSAINKFLQTFYYNFDEDMQRLLQSSGRDIRDVVIVASMIEKEAANDEERALIASVIYNRLETGMPLGIDSTILYVHPEHEGAPTAEMLSEDSPYNTRDRLGLPPTPICSPGLPSIRAALSPASSNYFYYALDTETGAHRFFNNINDFNAFVATQDYGG